MNSISALLGKFDSLPNKFQHEDHGKHLKQHSGHHQDRQMSSPSNQSSRYEVSLSFSSSSISTHVKGVQVLEQELEVHFSGARFSQTAAPYLPTFEPPSADEVANNVLSFIENRIKQESDSGASPERINDLLSQARSGVERGFGEALEQIEKIGLMTEDLSEEIDQSFKTINTGIDDLITEYVVTSPVDVEDSDDEPALINQNSSAEQDRMITQEDSSKIQSRGVSARYSEFNALSESAAIQITTQDGDIVSFNLEQMQASFERGETSGQYASGSYSYSVDGDLDEGEIDALNQLMVQIEGMSDQFFSGDFQGAFQSAMELGFDSQEIAEFSVNLSQTSVQQVSAYQQIADLGGVNEVGSTASGRFDPLSDFFDSLQAALDKANAFSQSTDLVSSLFDRVANDRLAREQLSSDNVAATSPFEQMKEYVHALLEKM